MTGADPVARMQGIRRAGFVAIGAARALEAPGKVGMAMIVTAGVQPKDGSTVRAPAGWTPR